VRHGLRRWVRRVFFATLGLVLFFSTVPTWRYKPFCNGSPDYYIAGPQRTDFVDKVERAMDEAGMVHVRLGDSIYQPYLPLLDGWFSVEMDGRPWDRYDIRRNLEWRFVSNMAHGHGRSIRNTPRWEPIEIPPALVAAIEDHSDAYDIVPPIDTNDEYRIYENCDVKRAAAIRVEDMAE
jgi:hypothetical protein